MGNNSECLTHTGRERLQFLEVEVTRLSALVAQKNAALLLIRLQNYSAPNKCGMCRRILTSSDVRHCGWCPIPQVERALEAK